MKHIAALLFIAAAAQAADITIAVTIRDGATTNREVAQINNTNTAAKVIALWTDMGTNAPGKNAALQFKADSIAQAKSALVEAEAIKAVAAKNAAIEAAEREAARMGGE